MILQTSIPLRKATSQISYSSELILLGSCFAEHIAAKLIYHKFRIVSNPFGILFNPRAIENLIDLALDKRDYTEEDVFQHNERWHSYDAHSDLSGNAAGATVDKLNVALKTTNQQINKSTHIIITLGTAWVYRLKKTGQTVANCHKVPQKEFAKELLSIQEIIGSLENIIEKVQGANKDAVLIFTVSPVRHLKDGFVENTQSKSHLISAVHQLTDDKKICYFPSLEIMMDELRDYRYYDRDMVHPNEIAVDYIWDRFKKVWIDEKAYVVMDKVEQIQKGMLHKPFNPESAQHQQFIKGIDEKIKELQTAYTFMKF